ncbi:MAG: M16 family metallopeptidase [Gammaproteobacteria bacterium]
MRNSRIILTLFFLCFVNAAGATAKIQNWETEQGGRVYYVYTNGLPLVDLRIVFDAGSARDGSQFGASALTSSLLDKGAGKWSADEIARRFEDTGAQFGTGISRDNAWLSLRSLTREDLLAQALDTVKAVLSEPAFRGEDFEREKSRMLAGLKHREASPGALADIAFNRSLYGEHPYAHPETGTIETVSPLTTDDVKAFYRKHYVSSNAVVVIVGDVSREQAEKISGMLLSGLERGTPPEPLPEVVMPEQGKIERLEFPSKQTHVLSGLPGIHRKDPDYFPLVVGNHILGGSSLVSKIFEEVREKRGLAYSSYSYFSPMMRKGAFTMGLQTRNDQTEEALKVLNQTLKEFIEKGPTEKELEAAKKNITGGFVLRFDTNNELTEYVAMIGFYRLPLDYLDAYPRAVEKVTVESIKDAFRRRVDPNLLQTVTVGGSASEQVEK